jgi:hypothetical protein
LDFKAKRRKLNVTIEDKKFEVRFPLMGELDQYRQDITASKDGGSELLNNLLVALGLPLDAQAMLEPGDLEEIVLLLTDQKKS